MKTTIFFALLTSLLMFAAWRYRYDDGLCASIQTFAILAAILTGFSFYSKKTHHE